MDRFKGGISFLIVLTSIFTGIGAAILHPYVHLLQMEEYPVPQPEDTQQVLMKIDIADSCYVCTFSKKLTFDEGTDITPKLTLIPTIPQIISHVCFDYGYEPIIFLRAPPLV